MQMNVLIFQEDHIDSQQDSRYVHHKLYKVKLYFPLRLPHPIAQNKFTNPVDEKKVNNLYILTKKCTEKNRYSTKGQASYVYIWL